MGIDQIWREHNRPWSEFGILVFCGILVITIIIIAVCRCRKKISIIQAMAILAMVIFFAIVFASTVFTRTSTVRRYELVPFWSWLTIIRYHDRSLLKENILNLILLLPAGILLPLLLNHRVRLYRALFFGVLVSATIEISQLVFMRGLFEWDDMIHNGLGCMLGCLLTNCFVKKRKLE